MKLIYKKKKYKNMELIIKEAFQTYNRQMESIYEQLTYLKESYSSKEYNLLMEGFWDKVKKLAGDLATNIKGAGFNAGKAVGSNVASVGKSAEYVHNLGKDVWDKAVKLGEDAVAAAKELRGKISKTLNNAIAEVRKWPSQIWGSLTALYTSISTEIGEIWKKAKEKGDKWLTQAKTAITAIYQDIARTVTNNWASLKKYAQTKREEFEEMVKAKGEDLQQAAAVARQSKNDAMKKIGEFISRIMPKIKSGAIDVAQYAGLLCLGIVALPFYAAYWAMVKMHNLGDELVAAFNSGVETMKKGMSGAWNEFITKWNQTQGFTSGFATGKAKFATTAGDTETTETEEETFDKMKKNLDESEEEYPEPEEFEIGKTYMWKGTEVKYTGPSKRYPGRFVVKAVGKPPVAVKKEDLSKKTNDSYSYVITKFNKFNY